MVAHSFFLSIDMTEKMRKSKSIWPVHWITIGCNVRYIYLQSDLFPLTVAYIAFRNVATMLTNVCVSRSIRTNRKNRILADQMHNFISAQFRGFFFSSIHRYFFISAPNRRFFRHREPSSCRFASVDEKLMMVITC